ncbi:uncharacterized protein COLE_00110 [Cutaneotrichosporon oleaginosum]|uniref:uncharacterized protein n=1 Tax=Cutaneotrichosporon oleaginosum TaxID=879819 RepID=UPI0013229B20|nr:hypothetical protein COLE_00110 [Cutaneotrichosporon oleaginosum]
MVTEPEYDVPTATAGIFADLLADERLRLPKAVVDAANVEFEGAALPYLCVPFKFTEAISAIKGLEAAFASAIAASRFGTTPSQAIINTDHAALFVFSAFSTTINGMVALDPRLKGKFDDWDKADSHKYRYRGLATNIYRTRDGRFFHLHGSLNARASMTMVGLDWDDPARLQLTDREDIVPLYQAEVEKWDAKEIDRVANDEYKQAGSICYTYDEFKELPAGKAIIDVPVYELDKAADGPVVPWPEATENKPLSGIKVLELTRIIASPAIGKGLAEHGATVLRIVSSTLPDMHVLHPDLNQGKYVADLDLKSEAGKAKLRELIKDADVIIDGYRPGAVERLGFGRDAVRKINPSIIYVRESCYGFHGPWSHRSGWQQIADCLVGLSHAFGEKLGLPDGESVVPIFPNSDYGAGASALLGTLNALYRRATEGGVWNVDAALAYYDVWLMRLGFYPDAVWDKIRPASKLRHNWEMTTLLPAIIPELHARRPDVFSNPKFWHELPAPSYGEGAVVRTVRPVVKLEGVTIGVGRGPVQNGSDPAEWPKV